MAFMDRIPHSAAVNESVKLAKKYVHKGTSGYVNGVLRNFSRNKEKLMQIQKDNSLEYLKIKYSHPEWIINEWIDEYGLDFTERLLKANNTRPRLNIRVNTLKTTISNLKNLLCKYGYDLYETKYAKDGLVVKNPARITETEEFKSGYFIIQDESSMLVGQIANPKENDLVLDMCSAPGGKSTHLAQIMNNKGKIISWDIYEHKLKLVEKNASRLGIDIIETQKHDAAKINEEMINKFDICIVDAPCSGLGVIRRSPEIKMNRKESDIKDLVKIQKSILNNAKSYVKPGGTIIYSTCTIRQVENIDIINNFLNENKDFELEPFDEKLSSKENIEEAKSGYIQMFPHIHKTDGFFIARIKKKNR